MSHPDDETLVDLALGDPQSPALSDAAEHVTGCDECQHDVAQFRRAYGLVSAVEPSSATAVPTAAGSRATYAGWSAPPPQLWSRISDAIAVEPAPDAPRTRTPAPLRAVGDDAPHDAGAHSAGPGPSAAGRAGSGPDGGAGGGSGVRRGSRRVLSWAAGMAAAGLVIGLLTGRVLWAEPTPTTVSQVALDTLDTRQQRGEAALVSTDAGIGLRVSTTTPLAAGDGFLEVWLINNDGKRMVSVGVLRGNGPETFPISQALISQGYVVVDISQEQFDDKPQHSGDSLLRGTLPA